MGGRLGGIHPSFPYIRENIPKCHRRGQHISSFLSSYVFTHVFVCVSVCYSPVGHWFSAGLWAASARGAPDAARLRFHVYGPPRLPGSRPGLEEESRDQVMDDDFKLRSLLLWQRAPVPTVDYRCCRIIIPRSDSVAMSWKPTVL